MVAAREKKKEGEDKDIDDIRGGGTIKLLQADLATAKVARALYIS